MTEFSIMYTMGAGIGALIAIYVILAVLIALGVYALVRLAVLAKMKRKRPEEKDCANCPALKEKDAEIARLNERIKELEARPAAVVIPAETRTLSESLVAATAVTGSKISKKSIIAYLSGKYGKAVEINGRANRTPNGKLLMSDNHFAFAPDGKRVCFVYVYETDEGGVVSLVKLDEPYVQSLIPVHPDVKRSAFPKNKAKDWYSVVADDTFTEASYYAVLDHAIALISGQAVEAVTVEEPTPEVSLSESLAAARETGAVGIVTKQSIIDHLAKTFGEKVELNGRANRTPNGKLLMSDNHFAFAPDGKRVCFTYIYQDDDGKIIILLRTTAEHAQSIRAAHKATGVKSAFPKNKEKDWYSVIVDNTFTEKNVYDELDRAALNIIGAAPAVIEEPAEEVSLSESLAAARDTGAVGIVTKQSIIDHLAKTFGEKVELNGRANRTPNGKLLMSDNHFAFAPDGKRVCFTYIYQDDDGKIIILLRTTAAHAQSIRAAHKATGIKSAFPKNKEKDWYSVVVDGTFSAKNVYDELDRAALNIIGAAQGVIEEPAEEVSLSESLAAAKETGAVGIVTKQSIIDHLAKTFGEKVELNGRANRTPNGKLLMSDNHFAFAPDGKRVCFTYIYQDDDGKIIILLRTTAEHAQSIRAAHKATGIKSAFPKNKEKDWYSVVVDGTFSAKNVYDELDRAALNIIGAAPAVVEEPAEEVSLSESLAAAKETGAVGIVTKQSIIDHLAKTFGEKVELNGRANRTPNGKLLMSDNHFAFAPDGKRVCFTYIYQDDDGKIIILLRTTAEHAQDIRAAHKATGVRSAFPKNKEKDWYSVIVDNTFTEKGVYDELDRAALNIIGQLPPAKESTPIEESNEEVSLSESLAAARDTGAVGIVSKKSIMEHLAETFEDKVELNGRPNRTPNGKLLMSDNHFALAPDGKRVCFTYVYEDDDGKVIILIRTTAEHAQSIRAAHKATGVRSAFPKNKEKDWYSVVVDDSFTEKDVYDMLDKAVKNFLSANTSSASSAPVPAPEKETPTLPQKEEVSLSESLAAAREMGAVDLVSKKSIIHYLSETFGDKVEVNGRENRTPNGKLLMSDNHFAIGGGKRVCFTYVYEDDGKVMMLVRLGEAIAAGIRSAHKSTGVRSAFPKNKENDWYSVIVDDSFSEEDVYAVLSSSYDYVLNK